MAYDDGEVTKAPPAAGILQIAPVTNKSTHVQGGTIIGAKPANAFAVNMLLDAWAAAIGQPALVTSTVAEIASANVPRLGDRSRRGVSGVISKLPVRSVLLLAAGAQEDRLICLHYGPVPFTVPYLVLVACRSQQAASTFGNASRAV